MSTTASSISSSMNVLLVEDDDDVAAMIQAILDAAGHTSVRFSTTEGVLEHIGAHGPDLVLLDIMLPGKDGLSLCHEITAAQFEKPLKVIVVSAKPFEYDREHARKAGAHGFIVKPVNPETFLSEVMDVVRGRMTVQYWGVRGTLPVPGERTLRYGGNTSCVTVTTPGGPLIVFDGGTGVKRLSNHLLRNGPKRETGKILISHPHWDHINALPFFVPFYIPGNEFEICGAPQGKLSMRDLFHAQMDGAYFPITAREFGAHLLFRDVFEEEFSFGDIRVRSMLLSHPGNCLGYRLDYNGQSVCYVTDNELFHEGHPQHNPKYERDLADFVRETDVLITDSTYTDAEYPKKVGWGHSSTGKVAQLADQGAVKALHLFHHDPDQDDDAIDRKLAEAREHLAGLNSKVVCHAPHEGETLCL